MTQPALPDQLNAEDGPAWARLVAAVAAAKGKRIPVGALIDALSGRGFGLLILLLALPNVIPGPVIPGYSAITGIPAILVTAQLALGYASPVLPEWLRRRTLPRMRLLRALQRVSPVLARIERAVRPQLVHLIGPAGKRAAGALGVVTAFTMSLPIPFGNLPTGWGLILLSFGLLARDGAMLLVGAAVSLLAIAFDVALVWAGKELVQWWLG